MTDHKSVSSHALLRPVYDVIRLQGMEFYGYHGAFPEEKRLGQRFVVDLELYMDVSKPAAADDLADAVNYAEVYRLVKRCVEENQFNLIETLAETIAREVLHSTQCQGLKVVVHKPDAPIGGIFQDVAVEIMRMKSEPNASQHIHN